MSHFPELAPMFSALLESLAGRAVAVVGHARPDGDCIGSQIAMRHALAARGADVVCANLDAVPRRLEFLVNGTRFVRPDDPVLAGRASVFVDCADHARGGDRLKAAFPSPDGNIDHHLSNIGYARHNLVDSASAATCEILAGLFLDQGLAIDAVTAQALYTGILTDTGQFRFNSTSQRSFQIAGELVARGARPSEAGYQLYERESPGKLKLLQHFLSTLRMECGGRVCIGVLPEGIFAATNTNAEDTEGLVDYARCIDGVDVGVLIEERPAGGLKASLRAKDPAYRMDRIAAQFNGGGHACAAGLNLKIGLREFHARLVEAIAKQIAVVDQGNGRL